MKSAAGTIKLILLAVGMIVPAAVFAQSAFRMEAALSCPSGVCGLSSVELGGREPVARFQRINIFEKDDRQSEATANQANENYLPIGKLTSNVPIPDQTGEFFEGAQSTAFLISPCLIVTNYHSVYGVQTSKPDPQKNYSATFEIGRGEAKLSAKATPVAHGNYQGGPGWGDWAILKLENGKCFGEKPNVGWLEVAAIGDQTIARQQFMLAGYFGDKDFETPYADPSCKVHRATNEGLEHDCSSRPGASGSPMFAVTRNGTPVVLGVNSGPRNRVEGVNEYSRNKSNYGASMDEILYHPGVKKMILQDKARVPSGNPSKFKKPPPKEQQSTSA